MGSTLLLIGQRLKEARQSVGYTPEEVAQKLGISTDDLLLFESGRKSPPLSVLRKLAKLYGVFDSYFYGIDKLKGEVFTLLLDKAKELSLSPETISQLHRFIFLCREIVQLRQKLGILKPEIPRYIESQDLGELLESMGIPIIRLPLGKELSSAMVCDESFGAFILVNSDCPNPNQLIAHEYARILQGEKAHINAKDCPKAVPLRSRTSRPVSKVLWELVLKAVKHELISTSYAGDVLEVSPMEIEEFL
ncbi:helix-turn-helix domain-containing protein [Thermocrinis sp.]|uniref:helix-turn-helix domain-containing protein n=1 Tax=Thermocrinis sp. TaxID=2024383 RepID=UPI003C128A6E